MTPEWLLGSTGTFINIYPYTRADMHSYTCMHRHTQYKNLISTINKRAFSAHSDKYVALTNKVLYLLHENAQRKREGESPREERSDREIVWVKWRNPTRSVGSWNPVGSGWGHWWAVCSTGYYLLIGLWSSSESAEFLPTTQVSYLLAQSTNTVGFHFCAWKLFEHSWLWL